MGTKQKIDRDNSFVHVDDFIWAGSKEFCSKDTEHLRSVFKMPKENTASFKCIGINVRTTKNAVFVDQKGYINSLLPMGHSSRIQQGFRTDVLKSSSNFYHLIVSMREVFPKNISFIGQFSLTLWLFKVLGIVQKFLVS